MNTPNSTQPENTMGKPAGFFSRLEAFIIDLFMILLASLGGIGLVILIIRFFVRPVFDINLNIARYYPQMVSVLIVFYFLFFWTLLGYTPGKFLLGLKIVRQDGRKLGLGRAIVRFIGYWISAIVFFLGFIWIIFDTRREAWHDKLADTHVIYTWDKKKEPRITKTG